jgi:hypothetical protein
MEPTKLGEFRAVKSTGKPVTVEHWQKWVATGDPGQDFFRLRDGRSVKRVDTGKYLIAQTHEELTSNDPDAP